MNKKRIAAFVIILISFGGELFLFCNVRNDEFLVLTFVLAVLIVILMIYSLKNIETLFRVPLDIYRSRDVFWDLVINDFQARFVGSILGVFWAFINPVITMLLYWFVFQVGFRSGKVGNYPFILFLMTGLIPWFYVQESLNGGTSSLLEYSYLVKKMVFNVGILPVLKVASALFVHFFFIVFLIIIDCFYGIWPDLYALQTFYYIFCATFLVLGISYFAAGSTVFFRDISQVINIALTIGTWLTPIMWDAENVLPPLWNNVFKLNPFYYIVDGYRDALLFKNWFWEKPVWTVYFWIISISIYITGVKFFNRLKVHFSDVL